MGMEKRTLVIIDPQNDFCDHRGSLYVEGAHADMRRLAGHLAGSGGRYTDIVVSLDSHDTTAIFHPRFWLDGNGSHPAPYTRITAEDFSGGVWRAVSPEYQTAAERTFKAMAKKETGALIVWPEHCVISTWGHNISDVVREALSIWRENTGKAVRYVFKGENPCTDQFSIFEGLDDSYPETAFNTRLFDMLSDSASVTFAGEALTHCVGESVLSYVTMLMGKAQEVTLLADCCSPVAGFSGGVMLARLAEEGVALRDTKSR